MSQIKNTLHLSAGEHPLEEVLSLAFGYRCTQCGKTPTDSSNLISVKESGYCLSCEHIKVDQ
jgi:hypothetical protein